MATAEPLKSGQGSGLPDPVTVGICAYNEAQSIGPLLQQLCELDAPFLDEILVVSSGSTDGTQEIVQAIASRAQGRVRLLVEDRRNGKISAVNIILKEAKHDRIIFIDADTRLSPHCLRRIAETLSEPDVGGVGTRNIPTNPKESLTARVAACLWDAHHYVNLRRPVLGGDICGVRRVVGEVVSTGINDDWVLQCEIEKRGLHIRYLPDAITWMRVPTTFADYIRQRRRIYVGYAQEFARVHRRKATQNPFLAAQALAHVVVRQPLRLPFCLLLIGMELWAILLARFDLLAGRSNHAIWPIAHSTKGEIEVPVSSSVGPSGSSG